MLVSELFRRNPTGELPQWCRDILGAATARGDGLNRWLMRASIALRRCERSEQDILATLQAATVGEPLKPGEIARAVESSAQYLDNTGAPPVSRRTWSTVNESLRRQIIEQTDTDLVHHPVLIFG